MKKIIQVLAVPALLLGLVSCGGEAPGGTPDNADTTAATPEVVKKEVPTADLSIDMPALPADYVEHDLSEYGFAASIMAPADAAIHTSMLINNDGEQEQIVVRMSEESNVRLNIFKSTKGFVEAKVDVEGYTIDSFHSYLVEDETSAFYYAKKNVDDSDVFNFVCVWEKEGEYFQGSGNGGMETLTKEDALMLYAMTKSVK
jgi:hypothetical protein